jgi:hypothetical protein
VDKAKLFDSLDGLFAYDTGCTDSGIKDELLRNEVKNYLYALDENEFRLTLSKFIREYFLIDEALEKGYGVEDVKSFIDWLEREMDINL